MLAKEETANTLFQSLKIENENRMLAKIDSATYWNESFHLLLVLSPTGYFRNIIVSTSCWCYHQQVILEI